MWSGPVQDAPYNVVYAVSHALTVLSWFENLPEEETPPRWIWWSDKLLDNWFEKIKSDRKKDRPSSQEDESMVENELIDRSGLPPRQGHGD